MASEFDIRLSELHPINFESIRKLSVDYVKKLSVNEENKLWESLRHGTIEINEEAMLHQYMFSYGQMHSEKLFSAYKCLPENFFKNKIEIFDWGCGQGIGVSTYFDFLGQSNRDQIITKVNLIEPSKIALGRACSILRCYGICNVINAVNKRFDLLEFNDVNSDENVVKLHIFSNILDVDSFNLENFIHLFQSTQAGVNYFICVGPYYSNNLRMLNFVSAFNVLEMYASEDNVHWGPANNDWTRVMRVFKCSIKGVDDISAIKQHIVDLHKTTQFHAGFVLDSVYDKLSQCTDFKSKVVPLLSRLCMFNVSSNVEFCEGYGNIDPTLAVMNNLIIRGLPTISSLFIEQFFSKTFGISKIDDNKSAIKYKCAGYLSKDELFEALHVVDPRFSISLNYNSSILESNFEKDFISTLVSKYGDNAYLAQVLEPQRYLSSLIKIPNKQFAKDQRADFSLDVPYTVPADSNASMGFVVEIDGTHHFGEVSSHYDNLRDAALKYSCRPTYRLRNIDKANDLIENVTSNPEFNDYLRVLQGNCKKELSGTWLITLQCLLTPIAIARVQKVIIESLISGRLLLNADKWKITVVERDIPCAALAIDDLRQSLGNLYSLQGRSFHWPKVVLNIISSKEFVNSPLHNNNTASLDVLDHDLQDICIDVSMLIRDKIDNYVIPVKAKSFYKIRTSHHKKNGRKLYTSDFIPYLEICSKDVRGSYVYNSDRTDAKKSLVYFIQNIFRKRDFLPGQLPILSRVLSGKSTIGLLPTGGGKSLIYQLASLLQPGITIVVDPLISLMVDQYNSLIDLKIDICSYVNSRLSYSQRNINLAKMTNSSVLIEFLSPERYMDRSFRSRLVDMTIRNNVYFAYGVIDEVHCVSEWGHDFRTAYLHLGRNMSSFMKTKSSRLITIVGLTATASFDVLADVERELTFGNNFSMDSDVIVRPIDDKRPELHFIVCNVNPHFVKGKDYKLIGNEWTIKTEVSNSKKEYIAKMIDSIPRDLEKINKNINGVACVDSFYEKDKNGEFKNAGIIFCPHAHGSFGVKNNDNNNNNVGGLFEYLIKDNRLSIDSFIGGDDPNLSLDNFKSNRSNLMVATKAFGMGIDKPNVRYTIHFSHPSSIEGFVQEAGRAGRDGQNAISYILYMDQEYLMVSSDVISILSRTFSSVNFDWLRKDYMNSYILKDDFVTILVSHGSKLDLVESMCEKLKAHFHNVDEDIVKYFHNKSFKGEEKEKIIMWEFLNNILNPVPMNIVILQNSLRDKLQNDDFVLAYDHEKNAIRVSSESDRSKQYAYIFVKNFRPVFKYCNFDQSYCERVSNVLISIINGIKHDGATLEEWLSQSFHSNKVNKNGINNFILDSNVPDGSVYYYTLSWKNEYQQNQDSFSKNLFKIIREIAMNNNINIAPIQGSLSNLAKCENYDEMMSFLDNCTGNAWWITNKSKFQKLSRYFYSRRDKDDTEKIIYRMCCIGLVEDVTVDYLSNTYTIKVKKRSAGGYIDCLKQFLEKYYSKNMAQEEIKKVGMQKGDNEIQKCLGFLTNFIYTKTEQKRLRAISDMRLACSVGISEGGDELKEFIHLYFNSKYARMDYTIFEKSKGRNTNYSLTKDISQNENDYTIIEKYTRVIDYDDSGTEIDNMKHLYGAVLLNLRSNPFNGVLNILKSYCLFYLGVENNAKLANEAIDSYYNGFSELYGNGNNTIDFNTLEAVVTEVNSNLMSLGTPVVEKIVKESKDIIFLTIHSKWISDFRSKYIS